MRRFAHAVALIALSAALYCRGLAYAPEQVRLDPARMFNPIAESLLSRLFVAPPHLSPVAVILFGVRAPLVAAVAPPAQQSAGASATVSAVNLHAYEAPAHLPDTPLQEPSVMPVAVTHPQLAQSSVQVSAPPARVQFGNYAPYAPPAGAASEDVSVPVRVGGVHFSGVFSGTQAQTERTDAVRAMELCGTTDTASACPYLHEERMQNLAAGTDFTLRAGNTRLNFQLSGSVGHIVNHDVALYQYAPLDPDPQLGVSAAGSAADGSLLYYPGLADVVRHGVNARVAVPVSPALTVGLQYETSHYQGNYGALLTPGFDARKDTYLGNLTYQLPNSSSLITLSARQYRYQDSLAPNFNLTQTRADLSFTVKF